MNQVIAIDLAMNKSSKFIIYSDSKSVHFLAQQNKDALTLLITRLLNKMNVLSENDSIILTWIPSHIDIHGNERVDQTKKIGTPDRHISNTLIHTQPLTNSYTTNGSTIYEAPSVNG